MADRVPPRDLDWIVSVDDHVLEPPNVWQDRIPARYRDDAPRIVSTERGDRWLYLGKEIPITGLQAVIGRDKEDFSNEPISYSDMRPGCYDPKARLADMDTDRVLASMCFPSFPRFCGQTFYEGPDKDLGLLCVKAYNDWMIDEWSASAPGRFIPLVLIPLWDPVAAAAEMGRCAAKGAKAIAFSENPAPLGLPSIHSADGYWDPVFRAAEETGLAVCTHIGSSSKLPKPAEDAPHIISTALTPMNAVTTLVDWVFSGNLIRFPQLKLCLSEGGIGWVPYVLERADDTWDKQRWWSTREGTLRREVLDMKPSEQFRRQVYTCFIDDAHGVRSLDEIGIDNVMIETDYPHSDSTWPDSLPIARKALADRTAEEQWLILQGNARRVFDFEPATPPETASA
jgi:predicted TIM-barrel fold metal-dependent hydrolase